MSLHPEDLDTFDDCGAGIVDAIKHRLGLKLVAMNTRHASSKIYSPLIGSS